MTPDDYLADGYAPYSAPIRAKMTELRDKLHALGEQRGQPDEEQLGRYLAGIENLIAQGEAENGRRRSQLAASVGTPNAIPATPEARTASGNGPDAIRSRAFQAIESRGRQLDAGAADRLDSIIRSEPAAPHARYIAAVADPAYASAWRQVMRDKDRASLEMTPAERAALIEARAATEARDMTVGTGSAGGFALPFDLDPTLILTNAGSTNPLRQLATVKTITQKSTHVVTTDGVSAAYAAEGATVAVTTPTLAQPEVVTHRGSVHIRGSFELFQDWSGIQTEIARVFADAKDNLEASKFLTGSGTNEPEGILVTLAWDYAAPDAVGEFITMQNALEPRFQQGAVWLTNLAAVNAAQQLVAAADTSDAPIFDAAGRLLRRPVYEASYMPDGNWLYGDFRQGFIIADRLGMSVELVPYVYDGSGNLVGQRAMMALFRSGCLVINEDAFILGGLGS